MVYNMYQVREIIMFGWTENFSTQGPEHCHIYFCQNLADCTNNKDILLTLVHWHVTLTVPAQFGSGHG
jgi:hypothetical protein